MTATDLAKHRVRYAAQTLLDTLGKPTRIEQHHAHEDMLRFIEAGFPKGGDHAPRRDR